MPNADRSDQKLLAAALEIFREQGYVGATLEQVAQRAKLDLTDLRSQFADKSSLFTALFAAHNPIKDLLSALDSVEGESTEDIVRDVMRRMVKVIEQNEAFLELAAIDIQANNGALVSTMMLQVTPKALALLERLKALGELRPVADVILARTLIALLMGFVISERAMPQVARLAMRLFPQRAWLDGSVDLLLYGILEDDAH
ncbi:MAG: TetR/AcrR family transcriptional regulator [Chloroflexota bacterium]